MDYLIQERFLLASKKEHAKKEHFNKIQNFESFNFDTCFLNEKLKNDFDTQS